MFIDALLRVATAQAMGAGAVSASSVDLGNITPKRQIGTGETMGFGVSIDVAATVAATDIEAISATDAALTASVRSHSKITIPLAEALAGSLWFVPLPMGSPTQRFVGVRTTTAGGTITITAQLTPESLFSIAQQLYAKNYVV